MTPEYFAAMRLLLDSEPTPPEHVQWPGELVAGTYCCTSDCCAMPQLNPLALCRWAGKPGFASDGRSGFVRSTTTVQQGEHTLQCWQLDWDDGSGTVHEDTLWLDVHGDEAFTLYDQQGNANHYVLQEAEWVDERFWPEPLEAGHYRAEGPVPADMAQLELLPILDDPGLQTPSAITCLTQMIELSDGDISALTQWCYYDGREPASENRITLHIADAHHFTLTTEQGLSIDYCWDAAN